MTNYRSSLLAAAGLIALVLAASHAPAAAEPLEQAVVTALTHNPSIGAAQANRNALIEEQYEKHSDYFPQISLGATGGRMYADNSTSRGLNVTRGAGYSWLWEGNVTLRQLLFDGFETPRRVDAAGARKDSAVFKVIDTREQLALRTIIAYLDVLRGQESVALLNEQGRKIDSYIGRIEGMVSEGAADTAMADQARDIRAQLDSTLSGTQGQLRSSIAAYLELVGQAPSEPMAKPLLRPGLVPATPEEAVAYAQKSHPALKSAAMTEEAFAYEIDAEQAAYYPDVTGELSYLERDQEDIIGGESTDGRAVVRLNWNYALGGAQQARVRKTIHRRHESRAQMLERERQIARTIQTAYSDAVMAEEQMRSQADRVKINEGLVRAHTAQFEAAKVNILQIMQSDNALFNARLALINGEYRYMAAQYAILASTGRLQEALGITVASAADER